MWGAGPRFQDQNPPTAASLGPGWRRHLRPPVGLQGPVASAPGPSEPPGPGAPGPAHSRCSAEAARMTGPATALQADPGLCRRDGAPLPRERRPRCQPCAPLTTTRPGRIPKEPGSSASHGSASRGDAEGFTPSRPGSWEPRPSALGEGLSRLLLGTPTPTRAPVASVDLAPAEGHGGPCRLPTHRLGHASPSRILNRKPRFPQGGRPGPPPHVAKPRKVDLRPGSPTWPRLPGRTRRCEDACTRRSLPTPAQSAAPASVCRDALPVSRGFRHRGLGPPPESRPCNRASAP